MTNMCKQIGNTKCVKYLNKFIRSAFHRRKPAQIDGAVKIKWI